MPEFVIGRVILFGDEIIYESGADHPAFGGNHLDLVIGEIPLMIAESAGVRMRSDNRR